MNSFYLYCLLFIIDTCFNSYFLMVCSFKLLGQDSSQVHLWLLLLTQMVFYIAIIYQYLIHLKIKEIPIKNLLNFIIWSCAYHKTFIISNSLFLNNESRIKWIFFLMWNYLRFMISASLILFKRTKLLLY